MVVCLAGEDLVRAEQLLEQDHPGELVGQGQLTERQAMVNGLQIKSERPSDHEADIPTTLTAGLQEAAESDRIGLLTITVQQRDISPRRDPANNRLVLADLDQLQAGVADQQLPVVLDVICERRAQPADGDDDDSHDA